MTIKYNVVNAALLVAMAAGTFSATALASEAAVSEAEITSLPVEEITLPDYPVYKQNTLTIPTVAFEDHPAAYQNVSLVQTEQGRWQLSQAEEALLIEEIDAVELVRTDDFPVQVFLKVSGSFLNGCEGVGPVFPELSGNEMKVSAYYAWYDRAVTSCIQMLTPYEHVIALPVYGLDAGEYHYTLNDRFTGRFTLEQDNRLP